MFDITIDNLGDYCKFFTLSDGAVIIKFSTISIDDVIRLDNGFYIPKLVDVNLSGEIFEKCLTLMTLGPKNYIDGFFQQTIKPGIIEGTNVQRESDNIEYVRRHAVKFIVHDVNRPNFAKIKLKA